MSPVFSPFAVQAETRILAIRGRHGVMMMMMQRTSVRVGHGVFFVVVSVRIFTHVLLSHYKLCRPSWLNNDEAHVTVGAFRARRSIVVGDFRSKVMVSRSEDVGLFSLLSLVFVFSLLVRLRPRRSGSKFRSDKVPNRSGASCTKHVGVMLQQTHTHPPTRRAMDNT